ncbi:MAG: tRNA lysidine(34) synthetase TilS, partial [Bacteroidetes bacterium]|nr:tRNA lysidine(34) synthetase TilS [Bacteroidota bacterium]
GFKLLSDFFKDEKINALDKQNSRLLVNGNGEIIWVIGYRSDERYRVNPNEKKLVKLSL